MHAEGVAVSLADVIDWKLISCFAVYREAIGFIVEMHGDRSTVDVLGLPAEYHVWPQRVLATHARQLHWRHGCKDLAPHEDIVVVLVGFLARRYDLFGSPIFFLGLRCENAI